MSMLALLLVAQPLVAQPATPMPTAPRVIPACRAGQLRVSTDGRGGDFNGMSHSGTALVIRNVGAACALPTMPVVTMRDARGRVVPAVRRDAAGAGARQVVMLARGGRASLGLRWVSGPVYPRSRRVTVAQASVSIGRDTVKVPLAATLYGAAGQVVTFDQTPLQTA